MQSIVFDDPLFNVSEIITVMSTEFAQYNFSRTYLYDFWQVYVVFKGIRRITINGREYSLHKDEMLFIKPGTPYDLISSYEFCDLGVCSFVCDSPNMQSFPNEKIQLTKDEIDLFRKFIFLSTSYFKKLSAQPNAVKPLDTSNAAIIQSLKIHLELFLISVHEHLTGSSESTSILNKNFETRDSKLVMDVKEYFLNNLYTKLTVDQISKHFNLSQSTLSKVFKKITSQGLIEYYLNMKIDKAKTLIREGSLSLSTISEMLGFSDYTYFSILFKKIVDETPSNYQKRHEIAKAQVDRKFFSNF